MRLVAEVRFERTKTFWVFLAYETRELGLYSTPR